MNAPLTRLACGLVLALLQVPAAAEVYRCTRDGQTVFTDSPCGETPPLALPPPVVIQPVDPDLVRDHDQRRTQARKARDAADAEWLEQHAARRECEERIRRARADGHVTAGMSPADVRFVWGDPEAVQKGEDGERWRYRLNSGDRATVVFREGVVSQVQERGRSRRR